MDILSQHQYCRVCDILYIYFVSGYRHIGPMGLVKEPYGFASHDSKGVARVAMSVEFVPWVKLLGMINTYDGAGS